LYISHNVWSVGDVALLTPAAMQYFLHAIGTSLKNAI